MRMSRHALPLFAICICRLIANGAEPARDYAIRPVSAHRTN